MREMKFKTPEPENQLNNSHSKLKELLSRRMSWKNGDMPLIKIQDTASGMLIISEQEKTCNNTLKMFLDYEKNAQDICEEDRTTSKVDILIKLPPNI